MLFSLSKRSPESEIREDFDYGLRGAIRLSHYDFEILTTFHFLITSPERPKTVVDFIINVPVKSFCCAVLTGSFYTQRFFFLARG